MASGTQSQFMRIARSDTLTLGTFIVEATDPALEPYVASRFDFVCIDCQHSLVDERAAAELIYRSSLSPIAFVPRVSENNAAKIGRLLDAGADGVIVPGVDTAQDAERAVQAARFPPRGARSYGPLRADMGTSPDEIEARAAVLVMIETSLGLSNLDEICAVDGVSGIFVGPADLSVALGLDVSGAFASDQLNSFMESIVAAAKTAGLVVGAHAVDAASARRWHALGCDFVTVSSNRRLLAMAVASVAAELRAPVENGPSSDGPIY